MALIGYGRASSTSQSNDIQVAKLIAAGVNAEHDLFTEKRTGTTIARRDELAACLRHCRKGDVLAVCKLDRLARSMNDLSSIVADLDKRGIGFKVLDQPAIDTTTANGRLMLNMLGAFAEFETELRKERQREGIDKAKEKGVYRGRKASIDPAEIARLKAEGMGATDIARRLGVGRASVYRLLTDQVETAAA